MVHHDLANDCKRLITGQRADRSRVVVASSKDRTPAGGTDFCPSLCVAAESHRPPLCVTYDNPLTEFANECCLNRQGSAARKAQDGLVGEFVVSSNHVRNPLSFFADELGCSDSSQGNLAREGDRKSTRLNSSHLGISYAVFCLKK